MTAVTLPLEPGTDLTSDEPPILEISEILDDPQSRKKHKKKSKDSHKRSRSCSTDASCCSSSSKRKKKKKKHHRRSLDEPPSPKVNPIFLWVKEDNAKIVEVRCEDYDRRNRIKLTKTAGGWRATPHVEILKWQSEPKTEPKSPKIEPGLIKTELSAPKLEPESSVKCENEYTSDNEIPPPELEMCPVDDRQVCRNDDDRQMPPLERQTDIVVLFSDDDMADDEREMAEREEEMAKIAQEAAERAEREEEMAKIAQEAAERAEHEEEMAKIAQESAESEQDIADKEQEIAESEQAEKENAERAQTESVPEITEELTQNTILISDTTDSDCESMRQSTEAAGNFPEPAELVSDEPVPQITEHDSEPAKQVLEMAECKPDPVSTAENDSAASTDINTAENLDRTTEPGVISLDTPVESLAKRSVVDEPPIDPQEAGTANTPEIPETIPESTETKCEPEASKESTSFATAESSQAQQNAESIGHSESLKMEEAEEQPECNMKCCDESNHVDENHNNEFDSDPRSSCMIEPSNFVQDVEEILGAIENPHHRAETAENVAQKDVDEYDHSALMSELEEMMNERMKHESHKDVLDDIYTFVPSPSHSLEMAKPKPKDRPTSKIERVIEAVKAKSGLIAKANEEKAKEPQKMKTCDLESLDLLWRLPEGTTIHHSKPFDKEEHQMPACTTATISLVPPPVVTTAPSMAQPVQDEPLNLGKPRRPTPPVPQVQFIPPPGPLKKETPLCKVEVKSPFPLPMPIKHPEEHAKSSSKLTPEMAKTMEPLAQLKEIMSDPEVSVPDPLLVPKERLSALIANPKREIPRLMALSHEVKYPKVDTNLMEVSLAHLQLLLQSSKKEDELKLIQKHADILQSHLKNDASSLDPATMSALNQMLWFPYLSHLDMGRSSNPQDIMGMMNMMYPYNAWGQQSYDYAQQSHLMNFWQDMQKPSLGQNSHATKGFGDLYKQIPPMAPSLYTSAPSLDPSRVATSAASYQPRQHKHSRRHHSRTATLPHMTPDFLKPVTPDFLKTPGTPDFLKNSMPPDFRKSSATPDFLKSSATPDFLKSSATPDFLKSSATPDFLKPAFDMSAWALPQTSEAGRTPHRHSRPSVSEPPVAPTVTTASSSSEPKLKVRKFDVDPNAVPKLINKNLTGPTLPPLAAMSRQIPSHYYDTNHLWNPLYGAVEHREPDYSSSGHWNWTTPVTVSGK